MPGSLRPGTQRCLSCHAARPVRLLWLVEGVPGDGPVYLCADKPECRQKLRARDIGQLQFSPAVRPE